MLALLFAFASVASAADHEINLEVGWIGATDPAFDYFSNGNVLGSYGLRLGYAVHENVAVTLGWQHGVNGAGISGPSVDSVYVPSDDGDDDYGYYDSEDAFFAAMYTDQISVGAKADVKVLQWLHPYASVQVLGMRGLIRMDDDQTDDENLTQIEVAGLTGGLSGALGLDIPVPIRTGSRWAIAPYAELGYGWYAPMQFDLLGSVQFSGFTGRAGVGVRF